jgi:hypothetical protein
MMNKNTRKETQTRWAKFTHVGRQTKSITKSFKNSKLKVSFKAGNTRGKLVAQNKSNNTNNFNKYCVYKLICYDSNRKNVGQTGRPFHVRFK